MDIGFDQETLQRALSGSGIQTAPDWQTLRTRLDAARSAWQSIALGAAPAAVPSGSFDPAAARSVAAFGQFSFGVNPSALGNRKPSAGIEAAEAGDLLAHGRGRK